MDRIRIKEQAKKTLGSSLFADNWLYALLALLIVDVITSVVGTAIAGIGSLLVTGPMSVGAALVFLRLVRTGCRTDLRDCFSGFIQDLGQNILLGLLSALFIALWSLLLIVPGIIKAYAYSMIFYIKNDHPEYSWRECLRASQQMTNGYKMELFILDLSFVGWYIVGALCLGVGVLWVKPYHETAKAYYYEAMNNPQTSNI